MDQHPEPEQAQPSGTSGAAPKQTRVVAAPQSEGVTQATQVFNVELADDEDVQWEWTQMADGKRVVTGYTIIKKQVAEPGAPALESLSCAELLIELARLTTERDRMTEHTSSVTQADAVETAMIQEQLARLARVEALIAAKGCAASSQQ